MEYLSQMLSCAGFGDDVVCQDVDIQRAVCGGGSDEAHSVEAHRVRADLRHRLASSRFVQKRERALAAARHMVEATQHEDTGHSLGGQLLERRAKLKKHRFMTYIDVCREILRSEDLVGYVGHLPKGAPANGDFERTLHLCGLSPHGLPKGTSFDARVCTIQMGVWGKR